MVKTKRYKKRSVPKCLWRCMAMRLCIWTHPVVCSEYVSGGFYIFPIIPSFVPFINSMMLRISVPSGTCSSTCSTASNTDV